MGGEILLGTRELFPLRELRAVRAAEERPAGPGVALPDDQALALERQDGAA